MSTSNEDGPAKSKKPAVGSRFQKGQSGNPKGRPRKDRSAALLPTEFAALLKLETERPLTLTADGKPVTMSALQTVLRATVVAAARGNPHAQRNVLQMAATAQTQEAKAKREEYEAAILLKVQLECDRDILVAEGRAESDMVRHASDVEINSETLEVKNYLIFTHEEVEARRRAIEMRDFLIEKWPQMVLVAEEDGDDYLLESGRDMARALIEGINARLPSRLRRLLPGDVEPLAARGSPEEIWRAMAREIASVILRKKPG